MSKSVMVVDNIQGINGVDTKVNGEAYPQRIVARDGDVFVVVDGGGPFYAGMWRAVQEDEIVTIYYWVEFDYTECADFFSVEFADIRNRIVDIPNTNYPINQCMYMKDISDNRYPYSATLLEVIPGTQGMGIKFYLDVNPPGGDVQSCYATGAYPVVDEDFGRNVSESSFVIDIHNTVSSLYPPVSGDSVVEVDMLAISSFKNDPYPPIDLYSAPINVRYKFYKNGAVVSDEVNVGGRFERVRRGNLITVYYAINSVGDISYTDNVDAVDIVVEFPANTVTGTSLLISKPDKLIITKIINYGVNGDGWFHSDSVHRNSDGSFSIVQSLSFDANGYVVCRVVSCNQTDNTDGMTTDINERLICSEGSITWRHYE